MITIANDKISARISENGAELQSLVYNSMEYLWQAEATFWGKHSPVLFPIVGQLKEGKYVFEGKEYNLPRHGFARDKVFAAEFTSATSATFTLRSDEESLAIFPFPFIFKVEYKIKEANFCCTYIVENPAEKHMYFSVGGHPAFNLPLLATLNYSDYVLKFNDDKILQRYLLTDGLTNGATSALDLPEDELRLTPSLFYDDAIVLKNIKSDQVKLVTAKDAHGLTFSFKGFPYFGIWAAKDAPFICLEPWCGIADNTDHDYQLEHKEGINRLAPAESWQRSWNVELF